MIPLRDNIPSSTIPFINYAIIAVNTAVFIIELTAGDKLNLLITNYAFYPNELTLLLEGGRENFSPAKKVFTSMFMHGGFVHFIGNMLYLYIFGDNVEDRLGHLKYLVFYLFCGLSAVLMHYYFNPGSSVPTLGASGAIAGVMGAYFVFYPNAKVLTLVPIFIFIQFIEIPAFFFLVIWFLMQFVYASLSQAGEFESVAWWAHVGGFAAGFFIAFLWVLNKKLKRPLRW